MKRKKGEGNMNKFLKLTGVSMLAIVAASNANAAGYTCEELIEYTSCNAGYYLYTMTSSDCPAGYQYGKDVCYNEDTGFYPDTPQSECAAWESPVGIFLGDGCFGYDDEATEDFIPATT